MSNITYQNAAASWRINSKEEKELALEADCSEEAKRKYVKFFADNDPVYYTKGLSMIDKMLCMFRPNVSSEEKGFYIVDMIYSLHRFGCMFDEYFLYGYEQLSVRGRESYITDKKRWEYYSQFNDPQYIPVFDNKGMTYSVYKKYYHRDVCSVCGGGYRIRSN